MKTTLPQKIKTGAFTAIGFILLFATIFIIGKQKNLFDSTFTVHANFKNVAGLQVGNIVRFAGINVGTVEDISIINDSTVRVSLRLQTSVRKFIRSDASASIGSDGLMGDKIIQVAAGTTGNVNNNSMITGKDPVNMDQVIARLSGIANNAEQLTGDLAGIVSKVNNGHGSLGRLINNDKLARNLEGTMSSTQETVQSIKQSADGFSDNMQAVKHSFLLRGYFKKKEKQRIKDSTDKANAVIKNDKKKN